MTYLCRMCDTVFSTEEAVEKFGYLACIECHSLLIEEVHDDSVSELRELDNDSTMDGELQAPPF